MKPRTWRSKNIIYLLTCFTVLAACSRHQATPSSSPIAPLSMQAPQKIEESFSISPAPAEALPPTPATPKDSSLIRLTKSSLGKAFLMTTVITPATHAPILEHLQPKVVSFEMAGGRLALMEVDTLALYSEQSSTRLLQTFEILTEDDDAISFRWNLGLSALPLTESMGASDLPGSLDSMSSPVEHALHAQDSFVRTSSFIDNQLNIEQISRLSLSHIPLDLGSVLSGEGVSMDQQDMSVLVQTRLEPYAVNPHFKPQHISLASGVGYFETPHRDSDSEKMSSYALKWDLQAGPLTFALTSNTPEDMIPAIREGLLYWNRVAGQEILRVETGANPHEFPQKRRILVHWVDWKNGGFARASAQADPLTGELLYANIYLPSAFAESARKTIRKNLPAKTSKKTSATLTLSGFTRAELCHLDAALTTPEKLPEQAAQDYVRLVVAHEAGHTLGLRHNFAGSFESKVSSTAQRSLWRKYLKGENVGALTSSTVMDYLPSADNLLLSRALLNQQTLDYDRLALIRGGYTRSDLKVPSTQPLFCTDAEARDTNPILGCEIFDSGSSPIESYAFQLSAQKILVASTIANIVLPDQGDPEDILNAENMEKLDPERLAAIVSDSAKQGQKFMTPDAQVLSVDRSLRGRSWRNEKKYLQSTDSALNADLEKIQGLPGWLSRALGIAPSGRYISGALRRSALYRLRQKFSAKEARGEALSPKLQENLETLTLEVADKTEEQILVQVLQIFAGVQGSEKSKSLNSLLGIDSSKKLYREGLHFEKWEKSLADIAAHLILDTSGVEVLKNGEVPTVVVLPKYSAQVRKAAVGLLNAKTFQQEASSWMKIRREKIAAELLTRLEPYESIPASAEDLREWTETEAEIFEAVLETSPRKPKKASEN